MRDVAEIADGLRPRVTVSGRAIPRATLADRMAQAHVPALSVAVLDGGRMSSAAWGASTDTLFQAQSISKPVTAMAVVRLANQGALSLDAEVNDRLTSWQLPESAGVTIRRILSHSAGLNVPSHPGYAPGTPVPSMVEILDGLPPANTDPIRVVSPPGSAFAYSGGGFTVVARLLEDVTGTPFPALMRELVLDPLGMTASTYEQPLSPEWETRAAIGHDAQGNPLPGRWQIQPELAAGGLWTTPSDLVRVAAEMCAPEHVLDIASRDAMLIPQVPEGPGLGWMLDPRWLLLLDVMATIAEVFDWPQYLDERVTVTPDAMTLQTMPGTYEFEPGFDVVIRRVGDRLFSSLTGMPEAELFATTPTEFFVLDLDATTIRWADETLTFHFGGIQAEANRTHDAS
jgi:CubicO group peptidase (beta-lactamase class C family)